MTNRTLTAKAGVVLALLVLAGCVGEPQRTPVEAWAVAESICAARGWSGRSARVETDPERGYAGVVGRWEVPQRNGIQEV